MTSRVLGQSREVRVISQPRGAIGADNFALFAVPIIAPDEGEVLVRNEWTSVDPAIRIRMSAEPARGYTSSFAVGTAMDGIMTVGTVVESRRDGFSVGDVVTHGMGWREYATVPQSQGLLAGLGDLRKVPRGDVPKVWYLGPLGGMGLTAWAGLAQADALSGEGTIWVSAAAGAVGSLASQIAKIGGHRVIGSASGEEKVTYLTEVLGLDVGIDRLARPIVDSITPACGDGLDVYFDNVGGDHLDAALSLMRRRGRIVLCGAISDYDKPQKYGVRNMFDAIANEVILSGLRGSMHVGQLETMQMEMTPWLETGQIVSETTIFDGIESAPMALIELLRGATRGKTVVRIL